MKQIKKTKARLSKPYSNPAISGLLLLVIFLLPTQLGKHFFLAFSYLSGIRVDYLAPTLYLIDIFVFFLGIVYFRRLINLFRHKAVMTVVFLLVVNVLLAQSLPIALYSLVKIIEVFILGVVVYHTVINEKLVLVTLALSAGLQLLLSLLQLVYKHSLQGIFYFLGERMMTLSTPGIAKTSINGVEILRPYGTFSHPNSLAGFFLLIYILVLVYKPFNKYLLLKYGLLTMSGALIFISFSKIAIAALLLLTAYYFFLIAKKSCRICVFSRIVTLFVVGLLFMQTQHDPLTIQKRLELIGNSLTILTRHPIFGVGIGNYLIAQNQFVSHFSFFFNQPVHNIFLLYFAETGLFLGGIMAIILIYSYRKIVNPAFLLIIIAICITGLFDHYWLTLQQNVLLIGFVGGLSIRKKT